VNGGVGGGRERVLSGHENFMISLFRRAPPGEDPGGHNERKKKGKKKGKKSGVNGPWVKTQFLFRLRRGPGFVVKTEKKKEKKATANRRKAVRFASSFSYSLHVIIVSRMRLVRLSSIAEKRKGKGEEKKRPRESGRGGGRRSRPLLFSSFPHCSSRR